MVAARHPVRDELVNSRQAHQVLGVLSLLIRMAGPTSSIGIILQQARTEILSLIRSQESFHDRDAA